MIGRGYLSNEKLLRNLKINSYVLFHSTGRRVKTKEECKLQFSNEESALKFQPNRNLASGRFSQYRLKT